MTTSDDTRTRRLERMESHARSVASYDLGIAKSIRAAIKAANRDGMALTGLDEVVMRGIVTDLFHTCQITAE